MDKIDIYSIAKLQKAFELTSAKSDYFHVDAGKSFYTPMTLTGRELAPFYFLKEDKTDPSKHQKETNSKLNWIAQSFKI